MQQGIVKWFNNTKGFGIRCVLTSHQMAVKSTPAQALDHMRRGVIYQVVGQVAPRVFARQSATIWKMVFKLVPMVVTATMMTTAIKPANKPYSMAVAPCSLDKKLRMPWTILFMGTFLCYVRRCTADGLNLGA